MAKPTKYATPISIILSVLALIGIAAGLFWSSPIIVILFLAPTVIYEVYRTEGESTKYASWGMLGVLIIEVILIVFNISLDLIEFFEVSEKEVAGYNVPLGDIKIVGPSLMAVLSIILFVRTRGKYTKWLAVIIFITSFALIYVIDKDIFSQLLKYAGQEAIQKI